MDGGALEGHHRIDATYTATIVTLMLPRVALE